MLSAQSLSSIIERLTKLCRLDVVRCEGVCILELLSSVGLQILTGIADLLLVDHASTDCNAAGVPAQLPLKGVTSLVLEPRGGFSDAGLARLAVLTCLRSLTVSCPQVCACAFDAHWPNCFRHVRIPNDDRHRPHSVAMLEQPSVA
jgi:hypothetical protein